MSIKSALMTTAYQTMRTGRPGEPIGDPFQIGAGHVDPLAALNPGLVLDSRSTDWARFLCSIGEAPASVDCSACTVPGACDPGALNMPSVTMPFLAGTYTVKRTVRSVLASESATFTTEIEDAPSGAFSIMTSPSTFTLAPGASQTVTITLQARTNMSFGISYGAVTWVGSTGTKTRIPVGADITSLSAPPEVVARTKDQAAVSFQVTPGFDGRLVLQPAGLFASKVYNASITTGLNSTWWPANGLPPPGTPGATIVKIRPLSSGGSRIFARFALFDSDIPAPASASMYVYVNGVLVGSSASAGNNQVVDYIGSQGKELAVVLSGFYVPTNPTVVPLHVWQLPLPTTGNSAMSVTPSAVAATNGAPATVTVNLGASLVAANPGKRYLGLLMYFRESLSNYMGRITVVSYAR